MKRRILKAAAAALSAVVLLCGCDQGTGVKGTGAEILKYDVEPYELPQNEGMEFVKNLKIGWNLGNTLEASVKTAKTTNSETTWGNPLTTQEMIDMVRKAGFNTVRIPVTWSNHLEEDSFTVKGIFQRYMEADLRDL